MLQHHQTLQSFSVGHTGLTEELPPRAPVLLPGIRTNLLALGRGGGLEVKGWRCELGLGRLCALTGWRRCSGYRLGRPLFRLLWMFMEFTVFRNQNASDCCAASKYKHQSGVCTFRNPQCLEMLWEQKWSKHGPSAPITPCFLKEFFFSLFSDACCWNLRVHRGKSFWLNYLWSQVKFRVGEYLLLLLQTPGEDRNLAVCHLKMAACRRMEPPPLQQWRCQSGWVILLLSFLFLAWAVPIWQTCKNKSNIKEH